MPSCPIMMMFANPFRMIVVPPAAVVPHMSFVIVAVVHAPLRIDGNPFRMMGIDPARMIVMPPLRVVPFMVRVPVAVMVRMSHHRRSREQSSQSRGGEKCSKFHLDYLLENDSGEGDRPSLDESDA